MQDYANITGDGTYNLLKVETVCPVQLDITGDFDGGTLTLRKCRTPGGTYTDLISEGAAVAYTSATNPILYTGGFYLQAVLAGAGSPAISIGASGEFITDHPNAGLVP
jgi:hypothetical protein